MREAGSVWTLLPACVAYQSDPPERPKAFRKRDEFQQGAGQKMAGSLHRPGPDDDSLGLVARKHAGSSVDLCSQQILCLVAFAARVSSAFPRARTAWPPHLLPCRTI